MIDLKQLREDPDRFVRGARAKGSDVDIDRLLELDEERRRLTAAQEACRSEQKRLSKEMGPELGRRKGQLKKAEGEERARLEAGIAELEARPTALKGEIHAFDERIAAIEPEWRALQLAIPQPPADDGQRKVLPQPRNPATDLTHARTHERNETISRLGQPHGLRPPNFGCF